ncbi:MAG: DUF3971 domain-containing protein, partial [Pseudomonadota bacterium]
MVASLRMLAAIGSYLLIGLLVLTLLLAAAVGWSFNRAASEPQDISILSGIVEWGAARSTKQVDRLEINKLYLQRVGQGEIKIVMRDVDAFDASEERLGQSSEIALTFSIKSIRRGIISPRTVRLSDGAIRIVRNEDQRYSLADPPAAPGQTGIFESFTQGEFLGGSFEQASVERLQVDFFDASTGKDWITRDASAEILRTVDGYTVELEGAFDLEQTTSPISLDIVVDRSVELVTASLAVDNAPLADIAEVFVGPLPVEFTSRVSGAATLTLSLSGRLLRSNLIGKAGAGVFRVRSGDEATEDGEKERRADTIIQSAALDLSYSAEEGMGEGNRTGAITIKNARLVTEEINVAVEGSIFPTASGVVEFDLRAPELTLEALDQSNDDVVFTDLRAAGSVNAGARQSSFQTLGGSVYGASFDGNLTVILPANQPIGLNGALSVDGPVRRDDVLRLWPIEAAAAARRFVAERVEGGTFTDISTVLSIGGSADPSDAGMSDDDLSIEFSVDDAIITYAPGMRPIRDFSGQGKLRGNSFSLLAEGGRIDDIVMMGGSVDIPILRPKGAPATFSFSARGDAGSILSVLNDPP